MNTEFIRLKYIDDEFAPMTIYGPQGYGKSAYACKLLAEYYAQEMGKEEPDKECWEKVKEQIVFKPEDFIKHLRNMDGREPALIWDDAGLWLYALDFNKKFIKWVGKYLTAARSDFGTILLTTPRQDWIVKKVRNLPEAKQVKINKATGVKWRNGKRYRSWQRTALTYHPWQSPDTSKSGTKAIYRDNFQCRMPTYFYDWYEPYRDKYVEIAKNLMEEALGESDELSTLTEEELDTIEETKQNVREGMRDTEVPIPD